MDVSVYIKGQRLDLFDDEKIEINSSIKNISDISKLFAEFSQTFSVPASPVNNTIFTYWYDSTVDGTFNANLRVEAYIEVNSLPYRYGTIQLDNSKLKEGRPDSYAITFYGNTVNLSDLFADDELKDLDLSAYDHTYGPDIVDAFASPVIASGDIYYPMINAIGEMSIGTVGARDLIDASNTINYREFKPAIRLIRIIEAIEARYNITFTRDFFDRSVFYSLFLWLHKDAGNLVALGEEEVVQLSDHTQYGFVFEDSTDTITYSGNSGSGIRVLSIKVVPQAGFEGVTYNMKIYNNNILSVEKQGVGTKSFPYTFPRTSNVVQFRIQATEEFQFTTQIRAVRVGVPPTTTDVYLQTTSVQTLDAYLFIKDQVPELKIKELFTSLISQFNLVIRPTSQTEFYIDTLDNWYANGKAYDISRLVDIKEITVKRPDVKKQISFLYQKAGAILGERYFQNNGIGYGDLKAKYNIDGSELKIETQFENMLFERLPDESNGDLTAIQAGYSIDKDLQPYKGKPNMFYRNGYSDIDDTMYIQPSGELNRIWHTATEDNILVGQVTSSLNFGDDLSSYFYTAIEPGLYFNWWKSYIEDLFNRKTRVLQLKTLLPVSIIYKLQLNDRLIIGDKKYKISGYKSDLSTGNADIEIFTDYSPPIDSIENVIPITVDSTEYTVDSELLTVDMVSLHLPVTSYTINGISREDYFATASEENFEVRVSANTNWTVSKIDDGFGTSWFSTNRVNGQASGYVRVTVNLNGMGFRTGILRLTIGSVNFDLTINQYD